MIDKMYALVSGFFIDGFIPLLIAFLIAVPVLLLVARLFQGA